MAELSERDRLFNAIYRTVKEHGAGMERGLVRTVLEEVKSAIGFQSSAESVDALFDKGYFKERTPRE